MKKNRRVQLNILFIITVFMLIFLCPSSSKANSEITDNLNNDTIYKDYSRDKNISMSLDYGYNHYAKYGRTMRVSITVVNKGENFHGWIHSITPKAENNVVYKKEIYVASNTMEKFVIDIPLLDDTGLLKVSLLDQNQMTVVETDNTIRIGNGEYQAYMGVLSDEKQNLSYLDNFATKIFYLDENSLPDDYLGLDMLDVILINHFDTSKLGKKQLNAIEKWVNQGGTLVIGTGEYAKATLSALKDTYSITMLNETCSQFDLQVDEKLNQDLKKHILEYAEKRNIILEAIKNRNELLKQNGKKIIDINNISPDQWAEESINQLKVISVKKNIVNVKLRKSTNEISLVNCYLMQKRNIGDGMIQLFNIDIGLDKEETPFGSAILVSILDNMSNIKQQQLQKEYFGAYSNHDIYSGISYTDAKDIPKVGKFAILLIIYLFLMGPITFLVLRKWDKKIYTWLIVPALAVIFTFFIYLLGYNTRIKEPFAGYIDLLHFTDDNKVNEEIYLALTAPFNNKYSIKLDNNYQITELNKSGYNYYMFDSRPNKEIDLQKFTTSINNNVYGSELQINNNPAFSPVYYQTKSSFNMKNQLTYNLSYIGDKINGTVTNGYEFDCSNVILLSDGYLIYIGDVKKGETVSLINKKTLFLTSRDIFYNNDIINAIGNQQENDNTQEANRITNILYYLAENKLFTKPKCSYLIGFVKDQDKSFQQSIPKDSIMKDLLKQMDCYGSKIIMLDVEADYTKNNLTFVPSIDSYMDVNENYYDIYYSYRYLTNDSKTVEYHFPESDHIISFDYLINRNQKFDSDYQKNFEGKIYFLNNKTGDFDEVFQNGVGSTVTDLKNYLTKQNTITIRYTSDISLQAYQMLLPYISYWKEVKSDAGN